MPVDLTSLADISALPFDTIIDARSPGEFAEDHVPGAINLPSLDDAERARVGTIYKQQSPFDARKIGAALVARNVARHLDGPLADKSGGWRPLVYCWRGGQRSGAFATILAQIGWRAEVVRGGYKAYRRLVVQALYDSALPHRLVLIDGGTGTAKTRLLALLAEAGAQVVDLEALAGHRGSLFGGMADQPSQKMFESRLAMALAVLDPARPVLVEAESARIGALKLPPSVWQAMQAGTRIEVTAPLPRRAAYLARTYADLARDAARLSATIDKLRPYQPAERIAEWQEQAATGRIEALATGLMQHHYDPRYARSAAAMAPPVARIALPDLDEVSLAAAVPRVMTSAG